MSNTHKYQAPCTNVEMANKPVINKIIRHFGGDDPCICHSSSVIKTDNVTRKGRPSVNRCGRSETIIAAVNVISHASGRFSHGSTDQPSRTKSATTEKITSASASQFSH